MMGMRVPLLVALLIAITACSAPTPTAIRIDDPTPTPIPSATPDISATVAAGVSTARCRPPARYPRADRAAAPNVHAGPGAAPNVHAGPDAAPHACPDRDAGAHPESHINTRSHGYADAHSTSDACS